MNILIVGEFSAFAKHLKNGFKALGHKAIVVTNGDNFKGLNGEADDIKYSVPKDIQLFGWTFAGSHRLLNPFSTANLKRKIKSLDVSEIIFIINPVFVSSSFWQSGVDINLIRQYQRQGSKVILSCCGAAPSERNRKDLKYYNFMFPDGYPASTSLDEKKYQTLLRMADAIVPIGYDYRFSVTKYCNDNNIDKEVHSPIPLPITIEDSEINSCVGRKIVIFHGIIREDFKGTQFFVDALEKIKADYPDKVEAVVDGKMPYDKYVELLKRMDILLDQTNSYGMGVNAELGLMQGKVVLSGNEPENEEDMNIGPFPCINAKPDVDYLYEKLKYLVLNPEKIDHIKKESRDFAVKYLDARVIAQRYIDCVFNKNHE